MDEPAYTNQYDKPVYAVNYAHIHRKDDDMFELMLNGEYFLISKDMLESLAFITSTPSSMGLSIG